MRLHSFIQKAIKQNQPLLMMTWIGSFVAIFYKIIISMMTSGLLDSQFIIANCSTDLLGVHSKSIVIYAPLNNKIQRIEVEKISSRLLTAESSKFEKN